LAQEKKQEEKSEKAMAERNIQTNRSNEEGEESFGKKT